MSDLPDQAFAPRWVPPFDGPLLMRASAVLRVSTTDGRVVLEVNRRVALVLGIWCAVPVCVCLVLAFLLSANGTSMPPLVQACIGLSVVTAPVMAYMRLRRESERGPVMSFDQATRVFRFPRAGFEVQGDDVRCL